VQEVLHHVLEEAGVKPKQARAVVMAPDADPFGPEGENDSAPDGVLVFECSVIRPDDRAGIRGFYQQKERTAKYRSDVASPA
jgi:hypothetical protein